MVDSGLTSQVDYVLSTARSVRRKLDFETPVSRQDIEACIDVAVQAPTGLAGENWRFVVITDPELKAKIAAIYRDVLVQLSESRDVTLKPGHHALMARLHEIPCMIMVFSLGEPDVDTSAQLAFYGSILPAAWSLMLAMRARGIGTTWTTLLSSRSDEIRELLGIPEGVTQTVMLPEAYTKDANLKKAERKPASEVTYWNGWQNNA